MKNEILRQRRDFQLRFFVFVALVVFVAGCAPPGPRALLKGKKFLDRGDIANAVAELKIATSILSTNADAWNYLGVAEQQAGQLSDAAIAYQRALTLNRDLVEAHYNLGCLSLEQNQLDAARTELTAYTLRRGNSPEGWLKLGEAQLRARELAAAEKSFSTVLALDSKNPDAFNGLGLSQIQRGRFREAAQYFSAAIKANPNYAPAILNLATVADEYMHDRALALQNYRAYLALAPRPTNWDDVNAIVAGLEQKRAVAGPKPPAQPQPAAPAVNQMEAAGVASEQPQPKTQAPPPETPIHTLPSSKPLPVHKVYSNPPPHLPPPEVVQVRPEPILKTSAPIQEPAAQSQKTSSVTAEAPPKMEAGQSGTGSKLNPANWFHPQPEKNFEDNGVTPLPAPNSENDRVILTETVSSLPKSNPVSAPPASAPVSVSVSKPIHIVEPAPPVFPRYLRLSPKPPRAGNRQSAERVFAEAQRFEQEREFSRAMESYQQAARLDPAWFEAQYNYGVLAYRLREFNHSLSAYEMALAIKPSSLDARYNFALALKAAGYALDAVDELKKILASDPNEVRAHLALANLYAQQLHDYAQAREHYLKVLQLNPTNPQATDIRFWLSSNPP